MTALRLPEDVRRGEPRVHRPTTHDGYDHDEITLVDLIELGWSPADTRHAGVEGPSGPPALPDTYGLPPDNASVGEAPWLEVGAFEGEPDHAEAADADLDGLWGEEVPEPDEARQVEEPVAGVSDSERAIQLARSFLLEEGLLEPGSLDRLADIIEQRGWSSVQYQVRGLVRAGYGIGQIHRMFLVTDAWTHYVGGDRLAPEYWHAEPRLSWLEAARLLDFLGYEAELEQVGDFLAEELEVWSQVRADEGTFAAFKGYLFNYRLSPRTFVGDGVWQVNLSPDDPRSFDGTRNPSCEPSWWDEPTECGVADLDLLFGRVWSAPRIIESFFCGDGELY